MQIAMLLARIHAHPRDARVRFDEAAHKYYIDGARYPSSVSGLMHEYFPQFDAAATVEKYFQSWARNRSSKYASLIGFLRARLELPDELAKREIVRHWSASGARASGDGTDTHLQIELSLNDEAHNAESPEFKQYLAWRATRPTWKRYRTEWSVFSEPELICGQIDSLWVDDEGAFHMADWKRVKEMKKEGFRGECGFEPLQTLANTNLGHYTLQQNVYAWMLEQHYGLKVATLCLVQVHPELDAFQEHALPRIDAQVEVIMERRRARVAAGELVASAPSAPPVHDDHADENAEDHADVVGKHIADYVRATAAALEHGEHPSVEACDAACASYDDWASDKNSRHCALISYITQTMGAPADLARLELAASAGLKETVLASKRKAADGDEARAEALRAWLLARRSLAA
jgi:hypothetical protein